MHFKDDVIAFIGPACAFALEPVARLAAYWNTPIITGMGDQVTTNFVINFIELDWNESRKKCDNLAIGGRISLSNLFWFLLKQREKTMIERDK